MGMTSKRLLVTILLVASCIATSFAGGDIQRGKEKSATCVACHGSDGNSVNPAWPKIAGQNQRYLLQQLKLFKKGEKGGRNNAVMYPIVEALSEQDMQDLAAYYASQTVTLGVAKAKGLNRGQQLYRGGDLDKHITGCIACHGPKGLGNNEALFPALRAQHADYVIAQLNAYKKGTRQSVENNIMQSIAKRMDENDMAAVANYIQGLN